MKSPRAIYFIISHNATIIYIYWFVAHITIGTMAYDRKNGPKIISPYIPQVPARNDNTSIYI